MDHNHLTHIAFEGPAGSGKTHRLIEALQLRLAERPLAPHEKVLALTYMNGARRRLDARLGELPALRGKFEVQTIDRFARSIMHGRRSLAQQLGLPLTRQDFNADCAAAGALTAHPGVAAWLANSYPIVLVDELQDADAGRLAIFQGLATSCDLIVAADEFQCLSPQLLPSQAVAWMHQACVLTSLEQNRRTANTTLLRAAKLLRDGKNLPLTGLLPITVPPGPLAHAFSIAQHLENNPADTVAIITPSVTPGYLATLERLAGATGKSRKFRPRFAHHEKSSKDEMANLKRLLSLPDRRDINACIDGLRASDNAQLSRLADWLRDKQKVAPLVELTDALIDERLSLIQHQVRNYGSAKERPLASMTVHGAKNREFDGVVVFWPYQVGGSDDHKRRLLYNAITRAKSWCAIVLAGKQLTNAVPFGPDC